MTSLELSMDERRQLVREIFLLALSVVAIINAILIFVPLLPTTDNRVLLIMNLIMAIIFFVDYLISQLRAESKVRYFLREFGWADLLSSIPFPPFPLFRVFSSAVTLRHLRQLGGRAAIRDLGLNRANGALYLAILLALVLVEFASLSIVSIESSNPEANIKTAGDAIWWSYVTITTIGYGDRYPVTGTGRFIGALLMTVGVGLFSVLTGYLANAFLGRPTSRPAQPAQDGAGLPMEVEIAASLSTADDLERLLREHEELVGRLRLHLERLEAEAGRQDEDA